MKLHGYFVRLHVDRTGRKRGGRNGRLDKGVPYAGQEPTTSSTAMPGCGENLGRRGLCQLREGLESGLCLGIAAEFGYSYGSYGRDT